MIGWWAPPSFGVGGLLGVGLAVGRGGGKLASQPLPQLVWGTGWGRGYRQMGWWGLIRDGTGCGEELWTVGQLAHPEMRWGESGGQLQAKGFAGRTWVVGQLTMPLIRVGGRLWAELTEGRGHRLIGVVGPIKGGPARGGAVGSWPAILAPYWGGESYQGWKWKGERAVGCWQAGPGHSGHYSIPVTDFIEREMYGVRQVLDLSE